MNKIKSIRAQLGVTQSALAKGIGVTQSNISHYERGQTVPPKVALRIIDFAKTLGVGLSFNDVYIAHSCYLDRDAPSRIHASREVMAHD